MFNRFKILIFVAIMVGYVARGFTKKVHYTYKRITLHHQCTVDMEEESSSISQIWRKPQEVLKLHQFKKKKKALQARINTVNCAKSEEQAVINYSSALKRRNPFVCEENPKKFKNTNCLSELEDSTDATLFKLLHFSHNTDLTLNKKIVTFSDDNNESLAAEAGKTSGQSWFPIDWSLKHKLRFMSHKPFVWSPNIKISEEASGVTSFVRCLDNSDASSSLDSSPNSKFYQCCLYWQQPSIPWLNLFPRIKTNNSNNFNMTSQMKTSLQQAFSNSLRSLYQLLKTRQCPFFYVCGNFFSALFRAAGIAGFSEIHVLVTPTTRGFRSMLKGEEIEYSMPLKPKLSNKPENCDNEFEQLDDDDDQWFKSMGLGDNDIKQFNYTQEKLHQKSESEIDNSEQSLILIEGIEVQGFYNFLINCKTITASIGHLAGIPPTLLSPIAFEGGSLNSLKIKESKMRTDNEDFYSLELTGPILPQTIHNLYTLNSKDQSMTATFTNYSSTLPFSKIKCTAKDETSGNSPSGSAVFRQTNLSDCGLSAPLLDHFCSGNARHIDVMECLKFSSENGSYTWS